MPPRQHKPPMIHLCNRPLWLISARRSHPLNQRPAACRTPIHFIFELHLCVAIAADPFHTSKLTRSTGGRPTLDQPKWVPHPFALSSEWVGDHKGQPSAIGSFAPASPWRRGKPAVNPRRSIFLNIYIIFSYLCHHLLCGLFLSIRYHGIERCVLGANQVVPSRPARSLKRPHKLFVLRFLGSKDLKTKYLRSIHAANALKREYLPKTTGGEGSPSDSNRFQTRPTIAK
jgi:hypothetical protein